MTEEALSGWSSYTIDQLDRQRVSTSREWAANVGLGALVIGLLSIAQGFPVYVDFLALAMVVWAWISYRSTSKTNYIYVDRSISVAVLLSLSVISIWDPNYITAPFYAPLALQVLFIERSTKWRLFLFFWTHNSFLLCVLNADVLPLGFTSTATYLSCVELTCVTAGILVALVAGYNRNLNLSISLTSKAYNRKLEHRVGEIREANTALVERQAQLESITGEVQRSLRDEQITQDNLNAAHQQLEQFAYAASHDLKEPIRTIRSFMQLVRRQLEPTFVTDRGLSEHFGFIASSCESMHTLLEKLLLYQRTGNDTEVPESFDLALLWQQVLLETIRSMRKLRLDGATDQGLTADQLATLNDATLAAPHQPAFVHLPKAHIKAIFSELATNALTFQDGTHAPQVSLQFSTEEERLHLVIVDNGIGIESRYQEQVFGMFKRLHPREVYPGSGLGLPLVRRIAELLDGRAYLASNPGDRTRVTVELPHPSEV